MRYRVILTDAQLRMVESCMSYCVAGELSGTPLQGTRDEDAEERRKVRLWNRAMKALQDAKRE